MEQNNLPLRIIDLREKNNMTQIQLAHEMGFEKSTMSKIENGSRKVSSDELRKLSHIFGVSADYLLGNKETSSENIDLKKDPVVLSYGGKPVSDEDMEIIKAILERHQNDKK